MGRLRADTNIDLINALVLVGQHNKRTSDTNKHYYRQCQSVRNQDYLFSMSVSPNRCRDWPTPTSTPTRKTVSSPSPRATPRHFSKRNLHSSSIFSSVQDCWSAHQKIFLSHRSVFFVMASGNKPKGRRTIFSPSWLESCAMLLSNHCPAKRGVHVGIGIYIISANELHLRF